MNLLTLLLKSVDIAEKDPHGIIITGISVSVVFIVLISLYLAYTLISKIVPRKNNSDNAIPACTDTTEQKDETVHDKESYEITIGKSYAKRHAPKIVASRSVGSSDLTNSDKSLKAPLPGVLISLNVNIGDHVKAGQVLATLEAMKMENDLESEYEGTVTAIHIAQGESVLEGATIITIA